MLNCHQGICKLISLKIISNFFFLHLNIKYFLLLIRKENGKKTLLCSIDTKKNKNGNCRKREKRKIKRNQKNVSLEQACLPHKNWLSQFLFCHEVKERKEQKKIIRKFVCNIHKGIRKKPNFHSMRLIFMRENIWSRKLEKILCI